MKTPFLLNIVLILVASGCRQVETKRVLHVACAANLSHVMPPLIVRFERDVDHQTAVVTSFGATAQLTQQIENGAPFDIFLAADSEHVEQLQRQKLVTRMFRYAQGRVVIYTRGGTELKELKDLAGARFRTIALANPSLAPFGKASVEALHRAGIWAAVESRLVYAHNIAEVKTYVDTGNADAGLTAMSLLGKSQGTEVDASLYDPVIQVGAVMTRSEVPGDAERLAKFLTSPTAQAIFQNAGYGTPHLK